MTLEYKLNQEDYADWIRWNLGKRDAKRNNLYLLGGYGVCALLLLGATLKNGEGDDLLIAIFLLIVLGAAIVYGSNNRQQFNLLMKRTGVCKMARKHSFPNITATFGEQEFKIFALGQDYYRHFSYADVKDIEESDRLFLIRTKSDMYQMIAKSAFADDKEKEEFLEFLKIKIRDARINPQNYSYSPASPLGRYCSDDKHKTVRKPKNISEFAHMQLAGDESDSQQDITTESKKKE